jgi:glycosyltransferase involved in cell wall biosynthesis
MLEDGVFGSTPLWRRQRLRPIVLAVFAYRYDTEFVPELLQNIAPMVDGWVALDDRKSPEPFSSEPARRRILISRAKELGATWVLAIDPDERIEHGGAARIRSLTAERNRIVWEFSLREMFTASSYRVDGIWGSKMQGRLFPIFDGPLCSEQPLHGPWCVAPPGYSILSAGLNLYHLKMMSRHERGARRDLYSYLDPDNLCQPAGYDYLIDETGAVFEQIPFDRDFFPAHRGPYQASVVDKRQCSGEQSGATISQTALCGAVYPVSGTTTTSQLGQLRISVGDKAQRESPLAVVVIGLCAPKSLLNAVHSLLDQEPAPEIVVVNSGGGAVAEVLGESVRSIVLVEVSHRVHVGAARNMGIQVSRAPFVAFLAADCLAAPGWVRTRLQAHLEGECAVGSAVDNDKPCNPFAWAAHLMTFGHRMGGLKSAGAAAYGASYDRTLFDKYGLFSEAMIVGEDSEFHSRFRRYHSVLLHNAIRTIHSNPDNPISFFKDQFWRGRRGRHVADFFGTNFSLGYVLLATAQRIARAVRSSLFCVQGRQRLPAIGSWLLLPLAGTFYLAGMATSYLSAKKSDRLFQNAIKLLLLGQPAASAGVLKQAIALRPGTARYHSALGSVLGELEKYEESVRELYFSRDLDRQRFFDLLPQNKPRHSVQTDADPAGPLLHLQLIVLSDSSPLELAQFLRAVQFQRSTVNRLDVFVIEAREHGNSSEQMRQVRQTYAELARFVSSEELAGILMNEVSGSRASDRCFLVVSSGSCVPPRDWLAVLKAHIGCHPEVEVFYGSCVHSKSERAGFIERFCEQFGFFPQTPELGAIRYFGIAVNWACDKSLLIRDGRLTNHPRKALSVWTLAHCALKAGGSSLFAPDWQTSFPMDSTVLKLLKRTYRDAYVGAERLKVAHAKQVAQKSCGAPRLHGAAAAGWRFAIEHFSLWRFTNPSMILYLPTLVVLFLVGYARQLGRIAGLRARREPIETFASLDFHGPELA